MMDADYGLGAANEAGSLAKAPYAEQMCRQPTLQERIKLAVKQAEEKLAAVKRASEILAKNPDLEELLNIMQRSHF